MVNGAIGVNCIGLGNMMIGSVQTGNARKGGEVGMNEFLKFFDEKASSFPMHMEIYYSKTMDWCITIEKWGCADEYPKSQSDGDDTVLCKVQDSDMELCFAKAHVALKEWLREFTGGY